MTDHFSSMISRKKKIIKYTAILLVFALFFVAYAVHTSRTNVYGYDSKSDYNYEFSDSNGQITDVTISAGKVLLPNLAGKTVFLKIKVKSNLLGRFFKPSITVEGKNYSDTNYFEIGAKGLRYLNLSSVLANGSNEVFLRSKMLSIDTVNAQLIIYDNPNLDQDKILVIAPHPDDAEIAAYGLYSTHPKTFVATLTKGDAGTFNYDELYKDTVKHYLQKSKLRFVNSIVVPLLGGVSKDSVLNLGYFDGTLESMYEAKSENINSLFTAEITTDRYRGLNFSVLKDSLNKASNWNSLVDDLSFLIKKINPTVIVTPYPKLDDHADHKFSTIAVFEAIMALELRKGKLFLYTNHTANNTYPIGTIGNSISLPPNFNTNLPFESLYSHELSQDAQMDKLLALEAMNDLRMDTEWRYWDKLAKRSGLGLSRKLLNKEKDYYIRSVRSNELFFVLPFEELYKNKAIFER